MSTRLDFDRLREVAEAVGDRPREWHYRKGLRGYPQQVLSDGNVALIAETYDEPTSRSTTAEYIATFDPVTVLALIDRLDGLDDLLCNALAAAEHGRYDGATVKSHLRSLIERVRGA